MANNLRTLSLTNAGDYGVIDITNSNYIHVTATKPISLVHFLPGSSDSVHYPAAMLIPPKEQYKTLYLFTTLPEQYGNILMVAIPQQQINGLLFNENPLQNIQWVAVANTSPQMVVASFTIPAGQHTIRHITYETFAAYVYGMLRHFFNIFFSFTMTACL